MKKNLIPSWGNMLSHYDFQMVNFSDEILKWLKRKIIAPSFYFVTVSFCAFQTLSEPFCLTFLSIFLSPCVNILHGGLESWYLLEYSNIIWYLEGSKNVWQTTNLCQSYKFTQRSLKIPLKTKWGDGKTFAPWNRFAMMP